MFGKWGKNNSIENAELARERELLLNNRHNNPKKVLSNSKSDSTSTTQIVGEAHYFTWIQFFIALVSFIIVVIIVVIIIFVYIPNKKKEDDEKAKQKIIDDAKAKAEADKKEKDKVFSKKSPAEILELEKIDYNSKKSRVVLFEKVDYNNSIDDTYNQINYKINTEKSLITDVTVSNGLGFRSIRISNCKVNLKNAKGDTVEYKHFMEEPDNWFKTNLTNNKDVNLIEKYDIAKITIMSEIMLYGIDGKVINSGLNKIDITDINRKDLPDIQFSGFKIRNCKIFLYPDKNFTGKEEIFNHSSKNDDANDDSKCFLYKSFDKTIFKSIKIEAFR